MTLFFLNSFFSFQNSTAFRRPASRVALDRNRRLKAIKRRRHDDSNVSTTSAKKSKKDDASAIGSSKYVDESIDVLAENVVEQQQQNDDDDDETARIEHNEPTADDRDRATEPSAEHAHDDSGDSGNSKIDWGGRERGAVERSVLRSAHAMM